MEFFAIVRKRRSIRRYQKQPVEPEKIALLLEAALRAPSSRGLNPWEFIVVDDESLINRLAGAKEHGSSFLKGARRGVLAGADPRGGEVGVEVPPSAST